MSGSQTRTDPLTDADLKQHRDLDGDELLSCLRAVRAYELAYAELLGKRRILGGWLEDGDDMERLRLRVVLREVCDRAVSMMLVVFKVWIHDHGTPEGWWFRKQYDRQTLEIVLETERFNNLDFREPLRLAWDGGGEAVRRLCAEGLRDFWDARNASSPDGVSPPERLVDDLFSVLFSAWAEHGGHGAYKSRYPDWDKHLLRANALYDYGKRMLAGGGVYEKIVAVHFMENAIHSNGVILRRIGIEPGELIALGDVPPAKTSRRI